MTQPRIKDRGKVFRDPVHRLIRVDPGDDFILDLIDTPQFQRLRRVRQLGVSWLTYHGAEHSRFAHSMGVFNFAQRILRALKDRYKNDTSLADYLEQHSRELKAAALLHDIGHGPFSHMIERAFKGGTDHENETIQLIEEGPIREVLEKANIDPTHVADIIRKTSKERLIIDIVSSQLDADRMDYLLRDSLMTGVEYGHYDAEWLIRNLCIGIDPGGDGGKKHEFSSYRLCLDRDRGLHSAEQLILARMHMTMQVYMHRVTRGYEVLLLNLFKLAAQAASNGGLPNGTPVVVVEYFKNSGTLSTDQWLTFDETAMSSAINVWAAVPDDNHPHLQKLSEAFLLRKRIYSSRVIDQAKLGFTGWSDVTNELENKSIRKNFDWGLDESKFMPYKGVLYAASKPAKDAEETSAESILLASGDRGDRANPVDAVSKVFRSLDFASQEIDRFYYDRDKADVIEPILKNYGITDER